MSNKRGVCILGATGSIGASALDVIARHPDKFELIALSAYNNVEKMLALCEKYQPQTVIMVDEIAADTLKTKLASDINLKSGAKALEEIVALASVSYVVAAIVGAAGLSSTLAAIRANKKILLANKESLVMSGEIFMSELTQSEAELIPIDSEHNAIFQCLPDDFCIGQNITGVKKIFLTGSGGPFLHDDINSLSEKTPAEAIQHPNWSMGAKISVDSATMMNKGLEWLEAKWLFGIAENDLEIIVHPRSIIHSIVEFIDGSVLAQMSQSDMRIPIAHAFGLPGRIKSGVASLNFYQLPEIEFLKPDLQKFPCLRLAREAWDQGGAASTVLNAANEVAVREFLQGNVKFTHIAGIVESTLTDMKITKAGTISEILETDRLARSLAKEYVERINT